MLTLGWNNVVSTFLPTLCNVVSTLFQHWALTLYQRLCNVVNPTSDFVSFSLSDQRYFNVDSQHWNNVDPTLKCWLGTAFDTSLATRHCPTSVTCTDCTFLPLKVNDSTTERWTERPIFFYFCLLKKNLYPVIQTQKAHIYAQHFFGTHQSTSVMDAK